MKRHLRHFLLVSLFWHLSFAANDQNPCTEEKEGCEVTKAPVLKVSTPEGGEVVPGTTVTRTFNYYIEPGEKITRDGNCETEEEPVTIDGTLLSPPAKDAGGFVPCEPGGTFTVKSPTALGTYTGCNGNVGLQLPEGKTEVTFTIKDFDIRFDKVTKREEINRFPSVSVAWDGTCLDRVVYAVTRGEQKIRIQTCPVYKEIPEGEPQFEPEPYTTEEEFERVPGSDCTIPSAISFRESGGPEYRKIALNGLPLPDKKPQYKEESDEADEETFIDPINLSLHHDTTDIYIPLPATELYLGVKRSVRPETWRPSKDLRPSEFLGKPFGPNWASNLSASIRFNRDGDHEYVYVTDDNGREFTFLQAYVWETGEPGSTDRKATHTEPAPTEVQGKTVTRMFIPLMATTDDRQTALYSLIQQPDGVYHFKRKFGSLLVYKQAVSQSVPSGREEAGKTYAYARLESVVDRYGNALEYTYAAATDLIPSKIQFVQVDESWPTHVIGGSLPIPINRGPAILISMNSHGYVESVTDPRGKTVTYGYETFNYTNPFEPAVYTHHQLVSVTAADGGMSHYTYSFFGDRDAQHPWDLSRAGLQLELGSISDPLGQAFTFAYTQNHTNTWWHSDDGYVTVTGLPLLVTGITLPDGNTTRFSTVANRSFQQDWNDIAATRTTTVIDADGNKRVYEFSDPQSEAVREWISDPGFEAPRMIFYRQSQIRSYSGSSLIGEETYRFAPSAGMALAEATDFSGNRTAFTYDDPFIYYAGGSYNVSGTVMTSGYYADPTTQTDAFGGVKRFTYGPHRIMTGITDENGVRTLYEVDAMGRRLKEQVIPVGNTTPVQETAFAYESATFRGFVTRKTVKKLSDTASWVTDLVVQYVPDATGRLWKEIVDPANLALTTLYTYDANGNKLTATDPRGNTTAFEYDDRNRLKKVTYPGGPTKTLTYDARGNKTSETDENGVTTLYAYDALNRVTTQTLVMGGTTPNLVRTFTYNALNSRTSETDPEGHTTALAYDALQRLITKTDPLGGVTAYAYGANAGGTVFDTSGWKPTLATDPRGFRTEVAYDKLYRPVQEKAEYQTGVFATTTKTYDAVGNLTSVTDPLGMVATTTYDALRRPLTVTEAANVPALAATTTKSYTSTGLDYRTVDPLDGETLTDYDAAGRPVKVTGPAVTGGRPVTLTAYDAASNVSTVTDPLGHTTDYTWDVRNRRTHEILPSVTDTTTGTASRPTRITTYDPVGNVVAVKDARGATTTTDYDAARRPTRVIAPAVTAPGGGTVTPTTVTTYDKNGNILTLTDPNGHTTTNTYDALNRLLTTTDAEGITVTNEYDAAGNRTAVIDGKSQRTEFGYDGLSRNTTTKDPAGHVVTLSYDAMNKTARVDAQGRRTEYTYDTRHRLTGVNYVGRTQDNRSYTYDKMSRILTVTEPGKGGIADVVYTYDTLGRILSEKSHGLTHLYTYDLAGNRTKVIYGGTGTVLNSTYDTLNRLATLTEGGRLTAYGYDLNGNRARLVLPNGDTTVTQFDALNRQVASQTTRWGGSTVLVDLTQAYDAVGNLCVLTETMPGTGLSTRTVTNSYDDANRLTGETVEESTGKVTVTTYDYDDAHNRLEKTVAVTVGGTTTTTVTTCTYNTLNQVLTATTGAAVISYAYDLDGNRVSRSDGTGSDTLTWDYENRLVSFTKETGEGAGEYTFVYDYRTRRVQAGAPGTSGGFTRFVFSGGTGVQERDSSLPSGVLVVENIRGSDWGGGVGGLLYTLRNSTPGYNHYNSRGDVIAKTNDSSTFTFAAQYEAFGDIRAQVGSNPDRQRSNTKDWDVPGYVNEGFRFRDLETGSFLSRDPLGFVDGPNLYAYVVQNPWTKFDPEGLKKKKDYEADIRRAYRTAELKQSNYIKEHKTLSEKESKQYDLFGKVSEAWTEASAQIKEAQEEIRRIEESAKVISLVSRIDVSKVEQFLDDDSALYADSRTLIMSGIVAENVAAYYGGKLAGTIIGQVVKRIGIVATRQAAKSVGSGPARGFIEVSESYSSVKAVKNFQGKGTDFVFDPTTKRFVMGNNELGHTGIARVMGVGEAQEARIVGGRIFRQDGKLITNEHSGHFGHQWTDSTRAQFQSFMDEMGVGSAHSATW
ncbi:type IV secretion protein Rhs [Opitutaceae bacterium TAV5]|nr:type IV secretion protein Rhs [Opitutaceae bacterium TAV5]